MEDELIFSSPEHFVLRVSYCDGAVSVVRQLFGLCTLSRPHFLSGCHET